MRCHTRPDRDDTGRAAPVHVEIAVLGRFSVSINGIPTASRGWTRRNAAALVKILALTPGHRLHRERMMDLLWPDEAPERCAPRLHKAAHYARQTAGRQDAIVLRDDLVWLFPGADITVDALRFEQLARAAVADDDSLAAQQALEWYRGELLPEDRYEDWAADRRELLHLRQLDLLRVAGQWRELAEQDPTHEAAHIELIRRQLAAGDRFAALRQYQHLERLLDRELGVAPSEDAQRVWREATRLDGEASTSSRVGQLLVELADLVTRQSAVLAELAAADAVHSAA